jgi:hypothetical protein
VLLSETKEGAAWLEQFEPGDVPTAAQFLNDLTIVTPILYEATMTSLVQSIVSKSDHPTALYPVWEIATSSSTQSIFPINKNPHPTSPDRIPDPTAGVRGSVGMAIQLIATIKKLQPDRVLDRPALRVLRATKSHQIVLIDDIIGSGKRVKEYVAAFYRHPTIKSWCSYPGLDVSLVCYAASQHGLKEIAGTRRKRPRGRLLTAPVSYNQLLYSGRSFWSDAQRQAVRDLCIKYARRTSRSGMPLGFGGAFSMIVFPSAVPNNTPAILWAGSRRWNPLFPQRAVPESLLRQFDQIQRDPAGEGLEDTLRRVGQLRLARLDWRRHTTPKYRELILLLSVLSRGFRAPDRVVDVMQTNRYEYADLIATARRLDLVDTTGALSERGLSELAYARTVGALPWMPAELHEERMYFPRSLRGRQGFV